MTLPLNIAQKLQQLLVTGQLISASSMQHRVVEKMLEDGILQRRQLSKTKAQIYMPDAAALNHYLHNHFGINDLYLYIEKLSGDDVTRAEAVTISGNSKLKSIRTFSGFLVNVYAPVKCKMHGKGFKINPLPGSYTFIHDYASFVPGPSVTIVGIENAENFSNIVKQEYLFNDLQVLFVCRYPQSNDLVTWLKLIPNTYLHFGDLDFEGINIYLNEFKKHLGGRSSFFIPPGTEDYLDRFGNRELYNRQLSRAPDVSTINEKGIQQLMQWIQDKKKVLEQEIFIREKIKEEERN